uniref:Immunoglobulin domain-containing protein n=1 Tax=Kryptolebias marmoratus TaxID=37003 RepID=A0A3Q3BKF2_KRYMA
MWILWKTPLAVIIVFLQIQGEFQLGQMFEFRCDYPAGWENNVKYFCRTDDDEDILITSRKSKTDSNEKYSIKDEGNTFYVTISDLQLEDSGTYWCGIERVDASRVDAGNIYSNVSSETQTNSDDLSYATVSFRKNTDCTSVTSQTESTTYSSVKYEPKGSCNV